jgi:two-component system, chemotaxis family, chemotaxis protein CheY
MRALVVDDAGVIRKIIIRVLNDLEIRDTIEAADGQAALNHFANYRFDLVVTDLHMPVMDGLEMVRCIREFDTTIPIVMVSVVGTRDTIIEALQLGVNEYLVKPFEKSQLLAILDKYIPLDVSEPSTIDS